MKTSTNIILKTIVVTLIIMFLASFMAASFGWHKDLSATKEGRDAWKKTFALIIFLSPALIVIIGGFVIWPKIKYLQKEYDRQNKGKKGKKKK